VIATGDHSLNPHHFVGRAFTDYKHRELVLSLLPNLAAPASMYRSPTRR
jgi:hypothetical protein